MNLPITRYYGSKRRVIQKIWDVLKEKDIRFQSILDIFGGTGIVSYFMLCHDKSVIYNDIFQFNCKIAEALLKTIRDTFTEDDAINLLNKMPDYNYKHIIEYNFNNIYYLKDENKIIDIVSQNIPFLPSNKQASAYYILFQSCMIKRPFNIFHRKNLNIRLNHTNSNFGNKITWEQPFDNLFVKFTKELNTFQFERLKDIQITNFSALDCKEKADLVYIDTPYFNVNGNNVSYHSRYHFLEGLMHYNEIENNIDNKKNNKEILINKNSQFEVKNSYLSDLDQLFRNYRTSTIVMSYTSNGYPNISQLKEVMQRYKKNVVEVSLGEYSFALNRSNKGREEILIIGK